MPLRLAAQCAQAAPTPGGRGANRNTAPPPSPVAEPGTTVVPLFAEEDDVALAPSSLTRDQKIKLLADLDERQIKTCTKCRLCQTRTNTVFGEGDPDAAIFFVGEGPGESEDLSGRPFVGRAGQKLDEMIGAMGLRREQVYIGNVVKCRPPGNRAPAPDETDACTPFLMKQLETVRPKVIVPLGLPATRFITKLDLTMGRMRGQWHQWRGIKVMPTYHPAYILRNYTPATRKAVWSDLQKVMAELGLTAKPKRE